MHRDRFLAPGLALALAVFVFNPIAQADNYGNAIQADQPTGFWRLNETAGTTAADSSPANNAAIYQPNTAGNRGQSGFLPYSGNSAVHFNGGSVYGPYDPNGAILSQNYAPAAQPYAYANNFTIEAWIKDSSPLPANELDPNFGSRMIFTGNYGFGLDEINEPHFVTYGRKDFYLTTTTVSQDKWHQMAVSFNGTDATFYIDGAKAGVVNVGHSTPNSLQTSTQFAIGRRLSAEAPWLGDIDEVAVFNSILSDAQILNHYQAALSEFGDADGDKQIGFSDLVAVAQNYGSSVSSFKLGDFDGDGLANFSDLVTVAQHYGTTIGESPAAGLAGAVPEPSAGAVGIMIGLFLGRRRSLARDAR